MVSVLFKIAGDICQLDVISNVTWNVRYVN